MHNNLVYVTGRGLIDAVDLSDAEWEELCAHNVRSTVRQLVKCAWCWDKDRDTQWMRTYDNHLGTRVISHQPGEATDHPQQSLETPEHKEYNERTFRVWSGEGYPTRKEARAADGKTRADVLAEGPVVVAFEHQHSPFKKGHGALERTRLARAAGRTALFHTDQTAIFNNSRRAPMLHTAGNLELHEIADLNRPLEFRGGLRRIELYTCTVRDGHLCPSRKFSGCGKVHAKTQVIAKVLDDVLRGAPVGLYVPMFDANVVEGPRNFWTDRQSHVAYETYIGIQQALDGAPERRARKKPGRRDGHSRRSGAEDLEPFTVAPLRRLSSDLVAPAMRRPIPGACGAGQPSCGKPARFYAAGWLCDEHRPGSRAAA